MSDPDAEIAGIQQHRAVQQLRRHVDEFMSIEDESLRDEELYHRVLAVRALAPGGTFYFTNIAAGNPYRPLIEYFGNWILIERSEEDIYRYCANAGVSRANVTIRRDETGLALLVEVSKLQ